MAQVTAKKQLDAAPDTPGLPSIDDRPDSDIVIYDGKCTFCRGQVAKLNRWDKTGRLAFVSLHDPIVRERCPDLTHEQLMDQMYVVTKAGKRYGGAAAFRYLSRKLPRLWLLAPILHIPFTLPIWQWGYQQVANRRYRLAQSNSDATCDDGTCDIHFGKK